MAEGSEKQTGAALAARPAEELRALLLSKQEELRKTQFKHASRELKQTHVLGHLRREMARLHTVLRQQVSKETA